MSVVADNYGGFLAESKPCGCTVWVSGGAYTQRRCREHGRQWHDRQAPQRAKWVCEPAWYWYQLGDARAVVRDREVRWGADPQPYQLEILRRAWRDEGEALGRLWACLLGDRS